jgi:putative membrane protein
MPDPTITEHLANERTFLAWIRTSISVIVFGFVVAKFGITLRELFRLQPGPGGAGGLEQSGWSLGIGIGFMLLGVLMSVVAVTRYHHTRQRLLTGQFQPAGPIVTFLAAITIAFGLVLSVYLLFTGLAH